MADDNSDDDESVSKSISKSESKSEDYSAGDVISKSKSEASKSNKVSVTSAGVEQPPQPKSRSVSVEEVVSPPAPAERKVSSVASEKSVEIKSVEIKSVDQAANDTDDDVEDEEIIEEVKENNSPVQAAAPPIPVVRKVSVPATPSPEVTVVVEEYPELTDAEMELSKRETVHLEEVVKAEAAAIVVPSVEVIEPEPEMSRKSSTASSADSVSSAI
jgi:hypothetical protein